MNGEFSVMESMLSGRSIVVAAKGQVSCHLAEEAVILGLKAGVYYGLNSVGARIWNLIQEPKAVHEIRDAILAEYEVDPDRCERDLLVLLRDLAARDLIKAKDETVP
jgi:hypothetical protein